MYYIEQLDNQLIKYKVELDIEKLKNLKIKIINDCGRIEHKSYDGIIDSSKTDYLHIKNYFKKKIGCHEPNDDLFYSSQDIYHFEYDYYHDTSLVTIINNLLDGKTNVILDLINKTIGLGAIEYLETREQEIQDRITNLHNEMPNVDNIGIIRVGNECEYLTIELRKIQQSKELNKNRKSELDYYPDVLECIKIMEVSRIVVDTIEQFNKLFKEVNSFFIPVTSTSINKDVDQELYKKLILK